MPLETIDLRALRSKIEAVEGTQETLAAADVVQFLEGSVQISTDNLERNLDRPAGGARPYIPIRRRALITGMIELTGAATAGDATPHTDFFRHCGHTSVLNVTPANQELTPVLTGFPSMTHGFYWAGELITAVGARGRFTSIDLAINDYAKAGIEVLGKVQAYAEQSVPFDDVSAYQEPTALIEDNLQILLDGVALEGVSLSLDPGINLALAYHSEAVISRQTTRAVTGTLRVYRPLIATSDIRSMAQSASKVPLLVDVVTGTAAQDLSLESASVQLGEPQNVDIDGLRGWDIPVTLLPVNNNDDYTLRFGSRT
jgi:hypothetical protein